MATGDVPDRVGHREDREPEGERDAEQADATCGNAAARTALPQPPKTSQNVPNNSAVTRFDSGMSSPFLTRSTPAPASLPENATPVSEAGA